MTILDTTVVIDRVRKRLVIPENISEVTIVEYPPILSYPRFKGKIYLVERKDWKLAIEIQTMLRGIGKPKDLADLLIAAIAINRSEELLTKDKDFEDIAKACSWKRECCVHALTGNSLRTLCSITTVQEAN